MNEVDIFFIIWVWVLPALAIMLSVLVPLVWVFIVPKVSKKLMWARFRNSSILAIADDTGWAELVVTAKSLPEGILETKTRGWRFMPRLRWKKKADANVSDDEAERLRKEEFAENLASRKYILKDLGKPFWFGYDGKTALVNPPTLAALQLNPVKSVGNPEGFLTNLREFAKTQPVNVYESMNKLIDELHENLAKKQSSLTILDPKVMKAVIPTMFTPSQIDALAANREMYGMLKKGHEYGKLIIGGALIIGLVILGIVAISYLMK